jgi:hypothetical protein
MARRDFKDHPKPLGLTSQFTAHPTDIPQEINLGEGLIFTSWCYHLPGARGTQLKATLETWASKSKDS